MPTEPAERLAAPAAPAEDRADGADGAGGAPRSAPRARAGAEYWIPLAYVALSSAWIALSDQAVAWLASTPAQHVAWSTAKGFGFVAVTGVLLHLGVRAALGRERRERRRAVESEALLRAIADTSPDAIYLKDRESRWIFANRATLRVAGATAEDVIGRTDLEIYPDQAVAAGLVAADREVIAAGRERILEELVETPGGVRTFLSAKAPFRDAGGNVVGVLGSSRDITDRKRMEEALRESEERLRLFVEHAPAAIAMLDRDMRYLAVSRRWLEDYRLPRCELLGRSHYELFPDLPERWRRIHERCLAGAVERCEEDPFPRADGEVDWVRWEIRPWRDAGDRVGGILLFTELITERKRAEASLAASAAALTASQEQLRQAQKLESIGRLAGGVAHDFNNLLTVILSCAESLDDQLARGLPASAEEVQEIRAAGRRASDLTRQLLAFARKQVIAPVPLDLNEVVRGSEKLLRRVLGEDVELVVSLRPDLWRARCDPGQLEQVILNLAVNARDAMPRGGRLVVETENVVGAGEEGGPPVEHVRLTIRDSGVGMTEEVKQHLFEPFFTTKPTGQGTGLGLATTYGIVKQSGGWIRVDSEAGRGTAVDVLLPRTREEPAPPPPPPAPRARGREPLLVVEDDATVREVTVRALRGAGYDVSVAGTPAEALALDPAALARMRLLVSDVVMPGMSGRALADALRARHPALRVLYVSGYTQDVIADRGVLASGVEFLAKPFTGAALLARVRAVLDA